MLRSDLDTFIQDALPVLGRPGTPVETTEGIWLVGVQYTAGETVTHKGAIYICIATTTGDEPPHTTYWTVVTVSHLRGQVNMDSADLLANYADGLLVGMALGIPVYRKAALGAGEYEYLDEAGNTLLTNVVD